MVLQIVVIGVLFKFFPCEESLTETIKTTKTFDATAEIDSTLDSHHIPHHK